jgi:hypothetical protein
VAICEGRFSRQHNAPLASSTVSSTISHVAAALRSHGHPNLTHNKQGAPGWNLTQQMRSYKNTDTKEIQQKAIPLGIISLITKADTTETQKATAQLIIGAFFFTFRSCKYLKVKNPEDKKTKILTIKNVAFSKNDNIIPHL